MIYFSSISDNCVNCVCPVVLWGSTFPHETGEVTCETASDIRDLEGVKEGIEEATEVEGRGDVDQKLALCVVVYVE